MYAFVFCFHAILTLFRKYISLQYSGGSLTDEEFNLLWKVSFPGGLHYFAEVGFVHTVKLQGSQSLK